MVKTVVGAMAAAILLTVAAELLLPEGNLRRYAAPVTGLLVLLAVLNPLLQLDLSLPDLLPQEQDTEAVLAASAQLAAEYQQQAETEYNDSLCQQLEALALLAPGVTAAQASQTANGVALTVTAPTDVSEKIYPLAKAFCGLDQQSLTIEITWE